LTFVIKRLARNDRGPLREKILDVLLDTRYALMEVIAAVQLGEADPSPGLFLKTWRELKPLVRESAKNHPGDVQARYAEFINSGDTLAALAAKRTVTATEATDDTFRIMARTLDPQAPEDPVHYSYDVDPELRTLMGFGEPLPQPNISPEVTLSSANPHDTHPGLFLNIQQINQSISI
jgi:hypothetical protein